MKIQQMKQGQMFVTLPKKVMEVIGWNKGDKVKIIDVSKEKVVMVKE